MLVVSLRLSERYAEFKEWFGKRAPELGAEVTLLTGDVKIRAPPGTRCELIICTSEILRNKVVKASGVARMSGGRAEAAAAAEAARAAASAAGAASGTVDAAAQRLAPDPDLERLGCVVSDEIHYINDIERGSVWEETLMHLPSDVQMVALSATLKDPEAFLAWIESTRGRAGELVRRHDRHVPLHVGSVDRLKPRDPYAEFFGTHARGRG